MNKKILLLITCILLLSGCTVEYNLEFNDQSIKENITIGPFDSNNVADFEYLTPYAIINNEDQELYEFDYSNKYLNLDYTYNIYNFKMSEALSNCYDVYNVSYDEEYYYILTSSKFKCLNYDFYSTNEVKIKFKTNHEVEEINADYVENDTYIWTINNNNKNSKAINIKLKKEEEEPNTPIEKETFLDYLKYLVVLGVLIGIIILIILHVKKKNERINEL